jgi:hypothetical protein
MLMRTFIGIGLLVIAGCSKAPANIQEAAKEAGCNVANYSDSTPDMFNSRSAECSDGAWVYWFPTEEANRNHGEMCRQVGGKKVASGKNWTKYSPSC